MAPLGDFTLAFSTLPAATRRRRITRAPHSAISAFHAVRSAMATPDHARAPILPSSRLNNIYALSPRTDVTLLILLGTGVYAHPLHGPPRVQPLGLRRTHYGAACGGVHPPPRPARRRRLAARRAWPHRGGPRHVAAISGASPGVAKRELRELAPVRVMIPVLTAPQVFCLFVCFVCFRSHVESASHGATAPRDHGATGDHKTPRRPGCF